MLGRKRFLFPQYQIIVILLIVVKVGKSKVVTIYGFFRVLSPPQKNQTNNTGFPLGLEKLENLEKWEGIFQSGKSQGILNRLEKSGKSQGKPHKILEN